jgi:hypothetical protein
VSDEFEHHLAESVTAEEKLFTEVTVMVSGVEPVWATLRV